MKIDTFFALGINAKVDAQTDIVYCYNIQPDTTAP